ncbi:MAG: thioredoxin domain-containing protein [Candidatus Korobacteraceae bacterium]
MNRCTVVLMTTSLAFASLYSNAQQKPATASNASAKSASTTSTNSQGSLPSQATFNAFLKRMFGWNQDLTWKVVDIKPAEAPGLSEATIIFSTPKGQQATRIYVTADQKHAFTGELVPFGADPFAEAREELKSVNGPSEGPKDAAITIVEFGDLECPACKAAQPNITKLMQDEPKARLVFENFPLEQIHKWSLTAAKYVDCLGRANNDAVWKFIATVYEHQSEVNEQNVDQMLKGYVKDAGGDPDAIAACAAKPETAKRVMDSMALGRKLGIDSTPTFFINGRRIVGFGANVPYDAVKSMVDFEVANAGK